MNPTPVLRDGKAAEPLTDAELDAIRDELRWYDSTSLVPRLLATIERDRAQ